MLNKFGDSHQTDSCLVLHAGSGCKGETIELAVEAALCDDLNTPVAIAALSEPIKVMNDLLYTKKVDKTRPKCMQCMFHAISCFPPRLKLLYTCQGPQE